MRRLIRPKEKVTSHPQEENLIPTLSCFLPTSAHTSVFQFSIYLPGLAVMEGEAAGKASLGGSHSAGVLVPG